MRKLIVTEFLSLDGVFEAPGPDGSGYKYEGWTFDYSDEEAMKFKNDELMTADIQLLGRITYDGFSKAWPKMEASTGEFGKKMNNMKKYVVSNSLEKADWKNTEVIQGDVAAEAKKIKEGEGGNILVAGSGQLVRFLMDNNLVDQFNLMVYPVVLGEGKQLFAGTGKKGLKLITTKPFKSGVVLFTYETTK